MKLAIFSDLHCEYLPFSAGRAALEADLVILAGDIHNGEVAIRLGRAMFPDQPIVQVAGNHEFYGGQWQREIERMKAAADRHDVQLLENEAVVIDGVRFLGATLWTDFELYAKPGRPRFLPADLAKASMQRRMPDFRVIRWQDRVLEPDDTVRMHRRSRDWLTRTLAQPHDGATVVITHHLPSIDSVAPPFMEASSNTALASDLDALFGQMDLWVHGHTHHSFDYRRGRTRVLANPRGYPMRDGSRENPVFDPALVVTV